MLPRESYSVYHRAYQLQTSCFYRPNYRRVTTYNSPLHPRQDFHQNPDPLLKNAMALAQFSNQDQDQDQDQNAMYRTPDDERDHLETAKNTNPKVSATLPFQR